MSETYCDIIGAISAIVLYQAPNDVRVMAQNGNDISISLENLVTTDE